MNILSEIAVAAILLMFAQNFALCGSADIDTLLRAAPVYRRLFAHAALIAAMGLICAAPCAWLNDALPADGAWDTARAAAYIAMTAALWLLLHLLSRILPERAGGAVRKALPLAALSDGLLLLPLFAANASFTLAQRMGAAVGAGVGFVFAGALLFEGLRRIQRPDLPRWLRGLPVALLYAGVLSLAATGFAGLPLEG